MNNKFFIAAVAAGLALPMAALPLFRLTPATPAVPGEMHARTEAAVKAAPAKAEARFSKATAKKMVTSINEDLSEIEKFGELELVFSEDFSKLTKGSMADPWMEELLNYYDSHELYQYPWNNFRRELTDIPGWGVGNAWDAGGCLYFPCMDSQAHVNTPIWDLRGEGGNIAVLEFKVRAASGTTYDYLLVEAAETNNWAPSWEMNETVNIAGIPDEWTTVRLIYQDCGPSFLFNIVGAGPGYLYVDDVKVYKMKPYLSIPKPTNHTHYNGTDFTVNWKPTPGAEKYILNVYDKEANGQIRDVIVKDQEVAGDATSYKVENAVSGNIYYYTVRAVAGDKSSVESRPHEVSDLEAPKMNPVELKGDYGYHASWNMVPQADVYDYYAYYKRVAEEDGEFVLTNEDFTGVALANGELTGYTKEGVQNKTIEDKAYAQHYPQDIRQQGWYGLHYAPFTDYISVCGWFYGRNSWDNAGFISPELDLSKDGGKVTINMDLAGEMTTLYDIYDNEYNFIETCAVALFNWNEEREDYDQVELVYVDKDSNGEWLPESERVGMDWKNFTVTLTKGSKRSVIGIYAVTGEGNLYIDNLKITQYYKKGESFLDPFAMRNYLGWHDNDSDDEENPGWIEGGNEVDIEIPMFATGTEIYHNAQAVRGFADNSQQRVVYGKSDYSEMAFVRSTISGVGSVDVENAVVSLENGIVRIENPDMAAVNIFDATGRMLFSSNEASVSHDLQAHGIYVVTVGKKAVKVIY